MTALGLDFEPLAHNSHAQPFADKGRRREVDKFTIREGFWMLGIVCVALMVTMLLFLFGYLNADMH
jgi:hypothetical protein